jgi:hypothetical protein
VDAVGRLWSVRKVVEGVGRLQYKVVTIRMDGGVF